MRLIRKILPALALIAAFAVWQWLERRNSDTDRVCFGIPRAAEVTDIGRAALLLHNAGFDTGYSEFFGNPLWVAYRLSPPDYPAPGSRPEDGFRRDDRSLRAVGPGAFSGTGYQRGHLAPNYAMYRVHGPEAQRDSFLMTNVSPQRPRLNQKAWQRLEEVIMDHLLPRNGPLCVLTGPVFDAAPEVLHSGVAVPAAFYKILVTRSSRPRVLAFLVAQDVTGHEPLDLFVTTVDEIEGLTGLDFLHVLEDPIETSIERAEPVGWGLEEVARLPPRY